MFMRLCFFVLIVLFIRPAYAADLFQNPVGRLLRVDANTFVFNEPPGKLGSSAALKGAIGIENGVVKYFPATTTSSGSGYTLGQPTELPARAFTVNDYRDVFQGSETVRWLHVSPIGQTLFSGWVSAGSRANPDTALSIQ